jgi:hypothetical protein
LTLAGDLTPPAIKTAPQDVLHGPIEGRARVYHAASMLIWGPPLRAGAGAFLLSPLPEGTQRHNLLPFTPNFPAWVGNRVGIKKDVVEPFSITS